MDPVTSCSLKCSDRTYYWLNFTKQPQFPTRTTRSLRVIFWMGHENSTQTLLHSLMSYARSTLQNTHLTKRSPTLLQWFIPPISPKTRHRKPLTKHLGSHQFSQIIIRENWTQNVGIAYILEKWKCANSPASNEAENEWEHYLERFSRLRCGRNLTYL